MAACPLACGFTLHPDGDGDHVCERDHRYHNKYAHHRGVLEDVAGVGVGQQIAYGKYYCQRADEQYLMLFPGLGSFVGGRALLGEEVGKAEEAPAQELRDDGGGQRVLPHGRELVKDKQSSQVSQDEAEDVHKDNGGDGDFHGEILLETDYHGHGHGKDGEDETVPETKERATDGGHSVEHCKTMNYPGSGHLVHTAKIMKKSVRRKIISIREWSLNANGL